LKGKNEKRREEKWFSDIMACLLGEELGEIVVEVREKG